MPFSIRRSPSASAQNQFNVGNVVIGSLTFAIESRRDSAGILLMMGRTVETSVRPPVRNQPLVPLGGADSETRPREVPGAEKSCKHRRDDVRFEPPEKMAVGSEMQFLMVPNSKSSGIPCGSFSHPEVLTKRMPRKRVNAPLDLHEPPERAVVGRASARRHPDSS